MTGLDHPPGDRWLTYNEIGEMLGVSPEAARAIARRGKWPRQAANAVGRVVRVLVPADRLRLVATNGHDNTGRRPHPDSSGPSQRSHPDSANGQDDSGHWSNAVESGLNQQPSPATQDSGQRAGTDESGRDQRTDLAALHEIAETFMAPVREQLADLKAQLVTERDRADRERDRADFAEVRAREAETRVKEVLDQLQTEMVEHRRVVG